MIVEHFHRIIKKNRITIPLICEIEEYVEKILNESIPEIPFNSYMCFYRDGSRKEFEKAYFERRKQLTALGLYLQWNNSTKAMEYFTELLWTISNEFSWCLAAHLSYGENEFKDDPDKIIDLFSSETAESLCEILEIHGDKIDKLLANHIYKQIENRIIQPFINKNWEWERAVHNWSAVCGGCIGILALLMEKGEKQKLILDKVERALEQYISGFGDDGASLEGIGYWSYGFGYYIYYKGLKKEILGEDDLLINQKEKIEAIADFPQKIQISEKAFVPFSDVPPNMDLPSGLISYLYDNYNINLPVIKKITSFNFDHCYRWAHVSRNLWWTSKEVLNQKLLNVSCYFKDAEWVINRREKIFFAIKGGSNSEPHNHNDVGSFVIAIDGELLLTDLGAGVYTKEYFGRKRYTYNNTRSYWHSVPIINGHEQEETVKKSNIIKYHTTGDYMEASLELESAYPSASLDKFYRNVKIDNVSGVINIRDRVYGKISVSLNEGFISYNEPKPLNAGQIAWRGKKSNLILNYDKNMFEYSIEKVEMNNHYNKLITVYRLSLISYSKHKKFDADFKFYYLGQTDIE